MKHLNNFHIPTLLGIESILHYANRMAYQLNMVVD